MALNVSLDLLHRYNVPGPRYTSYPTAPVWKEDFTPERYESVLAESAGSIRLRSQRKGRSESSAPPFL